jgi:hypothetical protein
MNFKKGLSRCGEPFFIYSPFLPNGRKAGKI